MIIRGTVLEIFVFYENKLNEDIEIIKIDDKVYSRDDFITDLKLHNLGDLFNVECKEKVLSLYTAENIVYKHSIEVVIC